MRIVALISLSGTDINHDFWAVGRVGYGLLTNDLFTTLLLGRSRSGAPFRDVFSISVVLSLSAVLQLSNISPGASMDKWKGRGRKENSDLQQTLVNENNSFPLCPLCFYLFIEAFFFNFLSVSSSNGNLPPCRWVLSTKHPSTWHFTYQCFGQNKPVIVTSPNPGIFNEQKFSLLPFVLFSFFLG